MSTAQNRPPVMEIQRVSMSFGGVQALDDVSFGVDEGRILALIGPNGAGKTTLLNVIAGTLTPTAGGVRYRGHKLNGLPTHQRVRLGIGRTFQQALVFGEMTVLENALVGCHVQGRSELFGAVIRLPYVRREEEDARLEALRVLNLVGLGSKADVPASALTFGQQRLLAIARALAARPSLLLLDEPAAGLNRMEKNDLGDLMRRIQEMGTTVVLVEHDMELVMRLAEWVVVLDHGRHLAEGTAREIRRNQAVIGAYLGAEVA